nr:unnamed protein product [Digitaria exilis]
MEHLRRGQAVAAVATSFSGRADALLQHSRRTRGQAAAARSSGTADARGCRLRRRAPPAGRRATTENRCAF